MSGGLIPVKARSHIGWQHKFVCRSLKRVVASRGGAVTTGVLRRLVMEGCQRAPSENRAAAGVSFWPLAAASVDNSRGSLGVKRTPRVSVVAAAYDPKRTSTKPAVALFRVVVSRMLGAFAIVPVFRDCAQD